MIKRITITNITHQCLINFKGYHCLFNILLILICTSCSKGDDPHTLELIHKHISQKSIHTTLDNNGVEKIISLSFPNKKESYEIFPFLSNLEHLVNLRIGGDTLTNDHLKNLPPLPNMTSLVLGQNMVSDEGLRYISAMKKLRRLSLSSTKVQGPGLAYLTGFDQLEWLDLGNTPLDDRGIPHIVANFPKLKRIELGNTNITPAGAMQLSNLLWLTNTAFPDDIANPGQEVKMSERLALLIKYERARLDAIRSARAAGKEAPSLEDEARLVEHIEFMKKSYEERLKIEENRLQK